MLSSKTTDIALLLLRLTFGGLMFVNHGWGKLMQFFADEPLKFDDPLGIGAPASLGLATFAEVACAALVVVGLFTRWAVIPLMITMFVAVFIVHAGDPFNNIESALMFLMAYAAIGLAGPGWYSVDAQLRKL